MEFMNLLNGAPDLGMGLWLLIFSGLLAFWAHMRPKDEHDYDEIAFKKAQFRLTKPEADGPVFKGSDRWCGAAAVKHPMITRVRRRRSTLDQATRFWH